MDNLFPSQAPVLLAQASERQAKKKAQHSADTQATVAQPGSPMATATNVMGHVSWQGLAALAVVAALLLVGLWMLLRRLFGRKDRDGFAKADYRIPHCKFVETPEGFKVSFRRQLALTAHLDPANIGAIGIVLLPFWAIAWLIALPIIIFRPTTIEVTGSAVIVNGKKMRRQDVGPFYISNKQRRRNRGHSRYQDALIGYTFGNKRVELLMVWREDEAQNFLAAFNQRLHQTPLAGEANVSPEVLRQAARTDEF